MTKCTICLRVYPGIAEKQKVFCDDKFTIYKKSLQSLVEAVGKTKVAYIILLDACPTYYSEITQKILAGTDHTIHEYPTKQGNAKTFAIQLDVLSKAESDIVYFAEDDYLYQPGSVEKFIQDFKDDPAEFGTLYYSPDYTSFGIHDYIPTGVQHSNNIYQYMASTTMTFFAKKEALVCYRKWLMSYTRGNHDFSMWFTITKYNIWKPRKPLMYIRKDIWSFKLRCYIRYKCAIKNFTIPQGRLMVPVISGATHIDKQGMDRTHTHGNTRRQRWDEILC